MPLVREKLHTAFHSKVFQDNRTNATFLDYVLPLVALRKMCQYESLDLYSYKTLSYMYVHGRCRFTLKQGFHSGLLCGFKTAYAPRNFDLNENIGLGKLSAIQNVSCFT